MGENEDQEARQGNQGAAVNLKRNRDAVKEGSLHRQAEGYRNSTARSEGHILLRKMKPGEKMTPLGGPHTESSK